MRWTVKVHWHCLYWNGWWNERHLLLQETTLYGATIKIHEPVGVIGIACPDDFPLLGFISLFSPAVIRGNTVIVVPSEKYPLVALDFYQVCNECGLHMFHIVIVVVVINRYMLITPKKITTIICMSIVLVVLMLVMTRDLLYFCTLLVSFHTYKINEITISLLLSQWSITIYLAPYNHK